MLVEQYKCEAFYKMADIKYNYFNDYQDALKYIKYVLKCAADKNNDNMLVSTYLLYAMTCMSSDKVDIAILEVKECID
jgi:hypothetical protein